MPKKTYTQINAVTLAAPTSSVTFSSIPQNFRDLVLVMTAQRTSSPTNMGMRFNGDSGSNYTNLFMGSDGSSVFAGAFPATNFQMDSRPYPPTTGFNNYITSIMDYSSADKHKIILNRVNGINEASGGPEAWASRWGSTAAITSVTLILGNFNTGCTFTLYGIEA